MIVKVSNCENCPFCVTDLDTEYVGNDTLLYCNLARFHEEESYITSYDSFDYSEPIKECDYCKNWEKRCIDWTKSGAKEVEEFNRLQCNCEYREPIIDIPDWCPLHEIKIIKDETT